MVVMSVFAYQE